MDETAPSGAVLVVTGPPGAGKSTVAHALAARLERAVLVRGDDVLGCVVSGFIAPWSPAADHQNRAATAATAAIAREYALAGYPVIVDAVLGPWHLDAFLAALGLPCDYVVLRPDRATTVERAVERDEGALTDVGPVEFMWDQFADLGRDTGYTAAADTGTVHPDGAGRGTDGGGGHDWEAHVLDNSALDVEATVDAVLAAGPKRRLAARAPSAKLVR